MPYHPWSTPKFWVDGQPEFVVPYIADYRDRYY